MNFFFKSQSLIVTKIFVVVVLDESLCIYFKYAIRQKLETELELESEAAILCLFLPISVFFTEKKYHDSKVTR